MNDTGERLPRVPWWGRLGARVVLALAVLGILSVGAGAYLLQLTVRYFDAIDEEQVSATRAALESAKPFYLELVDAKREVFELRAGRVAESMGNAESPEGLAPTLEAALAEDPELFHVELRPDGVAAGTRPTVDGRTLPVAVQVDLARGRTLVLTFGVDRALDERFQALGRVQRSLGKVRVGERFVERDEVERALVVAMGLASAAVLVLAMVAGFLVARQTTRKLGSLSRVMARVAEGDLDARAHGLGHDEIGQLAAAFNGMLDELEGARGKVAYLQRLGAWQEMARRLAHEIKNPLTPIQLAVQQLREKDPGIDEAFSRMLEASVEIVEDEVEGLRRMVTSFSQFAKVPEVRRALLDLNEVLREFERTYGQLGETEGAEVEVRIPEGAIEVLGDRQLLKQVLVNLVSNGIQATAADRDGGGRVRVTSRVDPDSVWIHVDDDGPGIEMERRGRVFEPYETTRAEGTGLGLAIVKKIVLDHEGEVAVDDAPADLGGARLSVRLPRTPARSSAPRGSVGPALE